MKKIIFVAALVACFSVFHDFNAKADAELVAPDFSVMDLDGKTAGLTDYKGKKPVLLFFWTSWCPFCLKELKNLNKTHAQLSQKGIDLLVINTSEKEHNARRVAKNYNLNFRVFLDEDGSAADAFGVYGVPTFVLIDQNGVVVSADNSFPGREIDILCREK